MNEILKKINDTVFYRYYHINATPFEVSVDNINKYGKGIYFLDNPYFYQDKFKDGMLIKIKPNLKNPKFYIEGSDITPNADYSSEIIDSLKNNIKNRNEFSDKLIKEGYDSIVVFEPRGIYLVMLYNDPDNYTIISDKKNVMAVGGEIKPLDFVSDSITQSIEELITKGNYSDITLVEALFFYKAFNDMSYGKGKFLSKDGLKGAVVKKLIDKNYIDESWLVYYGESDDFEVGDDNYSPTHKGIDFLNSIKNRHQTRIGLKDGTDLFPENANIKEYDGRISKNKEKLDKLISIIDNKKFTNGGELKKNSELLSKEFWNNRVPFLKSFNFFTDMPRFERILFQNHGSELSKTSILKDDIIKIKIKTFFEFIVYKHNINDIDFWYFIVKPTIFLKEVNGENDGLIFKVYLNVIKQLSESKTLRKEIMVSKDDILTDEQINSVVNDVNESFFKIEKFINDFEGKLTF
jgi:hypothetical protein